MIPFTTLTAVAAAVEVENIDTDMILPARFLKTTSRAGLGQALFNTARTAPDFVLNLPPWSSAGVLIALANFGCGSSREHAPWALLDFGIRCVVAPSFADIFYGNCFKNGILPIVLQLDEINELIRLTKNGRTATVTIDLQRQIIASVDTEYRFEIDSARKADLMAGVDEIARSLSLAPEITTYEKRRDAITPWLPKIVV